MELSSLSSVNQIDTTSQDQRKDSTVIIPNTEILEEEGEESNNKVNNKIENLEIEEEHSSLIDENNRTSVDGMAFGHKADSNNKYSLFVAFQTLGIVYGDIGTSPLYTFGTIFQNSDAPNENDILGALSATIYTILFLVIVKYLIFVMQAEDKGEGGSFAMYSLLSRTLKAGHYNLWWEELVAILAALGVSAILADAIFTPSISIISAVEGLKIVYPDLDRSYIVSFSAAIALIIFYLQRFGTAKVSLLFSPVFMLWFITISAIGIYNIAGYPSVLIAFNPMYALNFFFNNGSKGFTSLGGIMLSVTGAEALFANLGHFNASSIRTSALCVVLPSLLLCYTGQAAALLLEPKNHTSPFFLSVPSVLLYPVVILSVFAASIASQAVITASFTLATLGIRFRFLPKLVVIRTNKMQQGQVYVPAVCYSFGFLVLSVIILFHGSSELANAYGIAVCTDFLITTMLYSLIIVICFKKPLFYAFLFIITFGLFDLALFLSSLLKFQSGYYVLRPTAFLKSTAAGYAPVAVQEIGVGITL